jgi:diguanylate cyclase (GGDEF)-like protein/PAS domain S-box-containing protein
LQKDVVGLPQWSDIKNVILANEVYRFIGRHTHKDGSEIAVEVNTSHFKYHHKTYFVSVARNINRRLALELDLNTRNDRIWFALNAASDGFWEWQLSDNMVFFSDQLKKMLGYGPEEMTPNLQTWIDNVHPDDLQRVTDNLDEHLAGKRAVYHAQYRLRNRNGHYIWVDDKGKVCNRTAEGKASHVVGMVQDITDYKQLQFQLENLAAYDPLTGLLNRGEGEKQALSQFKLAQRCSSMVSIVVMDLDYFKQVNDLFGHQVGDLALALVGQILQSNKRESDVLYRWGGEEFVLLSLLMQPQAMLALTQEIHVAFSQANWQALGLKPQTLSMGVACSEAKSIEFESLLNLADKALYQAKQKGRNQTVIINASL